MILIDSTRTRRVYVGLPPRNFQRKASKCGDRGIYSRCFHHRNEYVSRVYEDTAGLMRREREEEKLSGLV